MHFCVWIGACIPETTMRVGGVRSVISATTSFHFVCSSGWSQTSVMSLIFWHAGYGSKGVANISGACVKPLRRIVLIHVAILRSWPLSVGAQVSSGESLHLLRVRSISSSGPHNCECSCLLVLTSTVPGWSERSVPFKLLKCSAILPCCGM